MKWDPNIETCRVEVVSLGQGVFQWTCFAQNFIAPVGVVWAIETSGDDGTIIIEILGSYVLPICRRFGVRSKIQEVMLNRPERIIVRTTNGSKTGGYAFMRAAGYTYDKTRSEWFFIKPKRRERKRQ